MSGPMTSSPSRLVASVDSSSLPVGMGDGDLDGLSSMSLIESRLEVGKLPFRGGGVVAGA